MHRDHSCASTAACTFGPKSRRKVALEVFRAPEKTHLTCRLSFSTWSCAGRTGVLLTIDSSDFFLLFSTQQGSNARPWSMRVTPKLQPQWSQSIRIRRIWIPVRTLRTAFFQPDQGCEFSRPFPRPPGSSPEERDAALSATPRLVFCHAPAAVPWQVGTSHQDLEVCGCPGCSRPTRYIKFSPKVPDLSRWFSRWRSWQPGIPTPSRRQLPIPTPAAPLGS